MEHEFPRSLVLLVDVALYPRRFRVVLHVKKHLASLLDGRIWDLPRPNGWLFLYEL